ncbi:hypothetical protein FOZ60_000865 [Perkinsus olseni]|uniref:Uncharacterized protein n=1 Tax=Perkinsus olseni TaxID=32597 RepID=A0A7J6PJS5_PEROL|nr:hypothetical protein FOZ60_000865 [Perkinsus olseni]
MGTQSMLHLLRKGFNKSQLPLPCPSVWEHNSVNERGDVCRVHEIITLNYSLPDGRRKGVPWNIWVYLDMRVVEEGFKVASIFTTLLHYMPPRTPPQRLLLSDQRRGSRYRNYWDSTPDGERVHCALGFDPESDSPSVRGLNYVARSRSSPQYGYLLEVSVWPGLKDRLKREFSIGERSAAAEKKLEGERVHNLKGHLMGELPVLSPWERLMLSYLDRGYNRDKLPFPCPPSSERKRRVQSRNICRAEETRNLITSNHDVSTEVGWTLWLELEVAVPSEGFRISSLFTSLWNHTPETELNFDMKRLRELEEGAERALIDETKVSDRLHMRRLCKQQLRNYMEYIREREGRPTEAGPKERPSRRNDWVTSDDSARETLMWLLTGVSTALPGNLKLNGGPYKTISYEGSMAVEGTPVGKVLNRVLS